MTRWYRAYVGTISDDKLAEVAIVADCSRCVAISVWHAILESAAADQAKGVFSTTPRRVAATLQERCETVVAVFAALTELQMIADGVIVAWQRRQFESDSSTARSRRHRQSHGNADATLQGRCATPPETDTDTDTEKKDTRARALEPKERETPRSVLLECLSAETAEGVIAHRQAIRKPLTLLATHRLVKAFNSTGDPEGAALMMVDRAWQGFNPNWYEKEKSNERPKSVHEAARINRERIDDLLGERPALLALGSGPPRGAPSRMLPDGGGGEP